MPTTVAGSIRNLQTGTVGSAQNAILRFHLRGIGNAQPTVSGAVIAPTSANGLYYYDFPADANGNVTGTLYSTRDSAGTGAGDIFVSGSGTAVYYAMVVVANGMQGPETLIHAKQSSTLDPSNVTPITTTPVVQAPTGDTTYLQLTGGNGPITGPLSLTSTITLSGSASDAAGAAGKINYRTDLSRLRYYDSAWHSLVGTDTADTLTNKTFSAAQFSDGGGNTYTASYVASNGIRIQPDSGNNVRGEFQIFPRGNVDDTGGELTIGFEDIVANPTDHTVLAIRATHSVPSFDIVEVPSGAGTLKDLRIGVDGNYTLVCKADGTHTALFANGPVKAQAIETTSSNPASAGQFRWANGDVWQVRNNANNANLDVIRSNAGTDTLSLGDASMTSVSIAAPTKSSSYSINSGNPATNGQYNLRNGDLIAVRNNANSANLDVIRSNAGADTINIGDAAMTSIGLAAPVTGLKVGTSGSSLGTVLTGSSSLTFGAIGANTSVEQNFTVTGASTTNFGVMVAPRATLGDLHFVWCAWVSGANTVTVRVGNISTGSLTPNVVTWGVTIFQ